MKADTDRNLDKYGHIERINMDSSTCTVFSGDQSSSWYRRSYRILSAETVHPAKLYRGTSENSDIRSQMYKTHDRWTLKFNFMYFK